MTEGSQHIAAVERLTELLQKKGFNVSKDMAWPVRVIDDDNDRVEWYYPDVTATRTLVIEVNGKVGHSSQRSYQNELNQKAFFENKNIKFYTYAPTEISGRGWIDSKGKRHTIHSNIELYSDWNL